MQAELSELIVSVTDGSWFNFLRSTQPHDEVNFWLPGGSVRKDLRAGTPWFFKLKKPHSAIAGGGFFKTFNRWPLAMVWDAFQQANGAATFEEFARIVAKNKNCSPNEIGEIGCVILSAPFFCDESKWLPPPNWAPGIQGRKSYKIDSIDGQVIWNRFLSGEPLGATASPLIVSGGFGKPQIILPRAGQGSFRLMVLDAYERRCCITGERTLPAIEAAHIRPFAEQPVHEINNGLAMRSDLHKLFDKGYITITPDAQLRVSKRIREEFENGRDYYALNDRVIRVPHDEKLRPSKEHLEWHASTLFRG